MALHEIAPPLSLAQDNYFHGWKIGAQAHVFWRSQVKVVTRYLRSTLQGRNLKLRWSQLCKPLLSITAMPRSTGIFSTNHNKQPSNCSHWKDRTVSSHSWCLNFTVRFFDFFRSRLFNPTLRTCRHKILLFAFLSSYYSGVFFISLPPYF